MFVQRCRTPPEREHPVGGIRNRLEREAVQRIGRTVIVDQLAEPGRRDRELARFDAEMKRREFAGKMIVVFSCREILALADECFDAEQVKSARVTGLGNRFIK